MPERQVVELDAVQWSQRQRISWARLYWSVEYFFHLVQRHFSFAVSINDVAHFLKRSEYEKRIDPHLKELSELNLPQIDEVQHHAQNTGAERVNAGPLNKAQATQISDLLQLQLKNLVCCGIQPLDL